MNVVSSFKSEMDKYKKNIEQDNKSLKKIQLKNSIIEK